MMGRSLSLSLSEAESSIFGFSLHGSEWLAMTLPGMSEAVMVLF